MVPVSLFSPGRVLWKKVLMKLCEYYIKPLKKGQRNFKYQNAYAIVLWSRDNSSNKSVLKTMHKNKS